MNNELVNLTLPEEVLDKIDKTTKKYIGQACLYEKENERDSAIRLFERVLFLENTSKNNELLYYLHMKIANIYETNGDKELSLKHYHSAYKRSMKMGNKIKQVDVLVNIIEIDFFIGDLEKAINNAYKVDDLLKEIEYDKGKLKISLFWLKLYYIKNEYYKAREIGNKALKLCGDEDAFYKGRILNILAKLYAEIVSVDEHLRLLNQALECFEQCGFIRGKLGVINNIGTVYSEKLEQYDEALGYFYKVKELSEKYDLDEFKAIVYNNIADIFFRQGRYELSYTNCKKALKYAKNIHMYDIVFYSYSLLTDAYLGMFEFRQANKNFKLANEEYRISPNQGKHLLWYLKSAATLYLELGDIKKAREYVNEAMVMLDNEESIVKWEIGLIYEKIKLINANNQMELDDVLNGIEYTFSKYQDSQTMLSKVYEIAILLYMRGYEEKATRFSMKYFELKVKNENTELKMNYLKTVILEKDNNSKIERLKIILEEAIEVSEIRIIYLVLSSLGDLYFENGYYEEALEYYYLSCEEAKKAMDLVPDQFKSDYFKYKNYYFKSSRILRGENKINGLYSRCKNSKKFKNEEKLESINKFICTMKKYT